MAYGYCSSGCCFDIVVDDDVCGCGRVVVVVVVVSITVVVYAIMNEVVAAAAVLVGEDNYDDVVNFEEDIHATVVMVDGRVSDLYELFCFEKVEIRKMSECSSHGQCY